MPAVAALQEARFLAANECAFDVEQVLGQSARGAEVLIEPLRQYESCNTSVGIEDRDMSPVHIRARTEGEESRPVSALDCEARLEVVLVELVAECRLEAASPPWSAGQGHGAHAFALDDRQKCDVILNDGEPLSDPRHARGRAHEREAVAGFVRSVVEQQGAPAHDLRVKSGIDAGFEWSLVGGGAHGVDGCSAFEARTSSPLAFGMVQNAS